MTVHWRNNRHILARFGTIHACIHGVVRNRFISKNIRRRVNMAEAMRFALSARLIAINSALTIALVCGALLPMAMEGDEPDMRLSTKNVVEEGQAVTVSLITTKTGVTTKPASPGGGDISAKAHPKVTAGGMPGLQLELVWIPRGTFIMGSPENEVGRRENEGPQTVVSIRYGFWMGKYEVTAGQLAAVLGRTGSHTGAKEWNAAANEVTWNEAAEFCRRVTEMERAADRVPAHYEYRLPTEAEWEYACRAGTATRFSLGDDLDGSVLEAGECVGDRVGDYLRGPKPVGSKKANPWGLYDMHGNVSEWCVDCLGKRYSGGTVVDPVGVTPPTTPVFRGGSWYDPASSCRSAWRHYINTKKIWDTPLWEVGFRIVLAPALISQERSHK
jgi:formylglycine-generating enzyme required for sulfatase activity